MVAYIGRRALLAVFTVWAISVLSFVIIQLPAGDYVILVHRPDGGVRQRRHRAGGAESEDPVRPRSAHLRAVLQVGQADRRGQLRHVHGVEAARGRGDRRPPVADGGRSLLAALFLTWVLALPIGIYSAVRQYSAGRLHRHVRGLHRPRRAQLSSRARAALPGLHPLQRQYRRALLRGASGRALERGQGVGPLQASPDPGLDPGAGGNGATDPDHARQSAGRAAQALRGDGALQEASRSSG